MEWFLPPGLSGEGLTLGRYFVTAWLASFCFIAVSLVAYSASGVWGQVVLVSVQGVVGAAMLALFRRTGRVRLATNISLAGAALMFGLATLVQTPPDLINVAFLGIVPLLASLIVGAHRAVWWAVSMSGWGVAMLWLALHGFTLPYPDPSPTFSSAINFMFMTALLYVFARTWADLHGRALDAAREADRAKSAFLAAVSHEIRTPMNGVLGMTELLLQTQLTDAQREQLAVVQRSGEALVSLINDLLDLSKAEAGKLTVEHAAFRLAPILHDVEALFAPDAANKRLGLRFELDAALPPVVRGDGLRLRQVLSNLVSNAIKFTEAGEVAVTVTRAAAGRLAFAVQDTGAGLSEEVLPHLFTLFHQATTPGRRRLGSTGLGLALSQQLVGLMGGRIDVASRVGAGSRFSFELPLPDAELPVPTSHVSPLPVASSRRVLVVDDNAVNLAVAAGLLQRAGFIADTASNGRDAVARTAMQDYALVLMDVQMPEMDGFEATARIRGLSGMAGQVPVVALTAAALPEDLEACRAAGMNDVLTKPVTWAALHALLKSLDLGAALGDAAGTRTTPGPAAPSPDDAGAVPAEVAGLPRADPGAAAPPADDGAASGSRR